MRLVEVLRSRAPPFMLSGGGQRLVGGAPFPRDGGAIELVWFAPPLRKKR